MKNCIFHLCFNIKQVISGIGINYNFMRLDRGLIIDACYYSARVS